MAQTFRQRIELGFEAFGRAVTARPLIALILSLALIAGLGSNIPNIVMDTSTESFLHDDDPALKAYNDFRDQFGRDELVMVAIEAPDVFAPAFLKKLEMLHRDLNDNTPHLDDINSLINARNTFGREDELIVEDLFETWPDTAEGFAEKRAQALRNPLFKNLLLSEDQKITTIVMRTNAFSTSGASEDDALSGFDDLAAPTGEAVERVYLTDEENSELVDAVRDIAAKYDSEDFKIRVGGSPVVVDVLKLSMQTNMKRFMLLAIGLIAVVLFVMFRRVSGVLLPLFVVFGSLIGTLGLLPLTGRAFTIPMQILPSFLLAVGIGASVHLMSVFFRHVQHGNGRRDSVIYALGHSGLPIVMTSLTTAAGLASFSGAEIAPVADLGLMASFGILLSLALTLVMLPALLTMLPLKAKSSTRAHKRHDRMDAILRWTADISVQRAPHILVISAVLLGIAIAGVTQLQFSHQPFKWLPEDEPARAATDFLDLRMKGASAVEVIVDTKRENGLYDPVIMQGLEQLNREIETLDTANYMVGKTLSLADILKESNRALHANDEAHYAIPDDRDLIAQELFLFENTGSDDMEDFVDSQFQKARFTAKMPWVDAIHLMSLDKDLTDRFQAVLGDGVDITVTGMNALLGRTLEATIYSMAESYVIAAFVITIMMVVFIGDIRIGLLSMIPNLTPILIALGLMGWLGIKLDLFTMLIGSIAIGLAVDDTIHFMHNYRRYHQKTGSVLSAVHDTLLSTGRAMLVTTVVLTIGFFVYIFSTMSNLVNFGWLTALTITMALIADFFLAPALMAVLHKAHLLPDDGDY